VFVVLAEAVAHSSEHVGALGHLVEIAHDTWKEVVNGGAITGGFLGYFVHSLHEKVWHRLWHVLPRILRGGHA
jgi:hypothetical protein